MILKTNEHDDPTAWSEARIFNEAFLLMVLERPELAALVGVLDFLGECDCDDCDSIVVACYDEETARLFSDGTPIQRRLSQLIERPVAIVFEQ